MLIFTRPVWSKRRTILDTERDGPETNKALLDIFTLTHISHGILGYLILKLFGMSDKTAIYGTMIFEILFEIAENTPFIIGAFRTARGGTPNYKGDSIANMVGDTIFCLLGAYTAHWSPIIGISYVIISELLFYKPKIGLLFHIPAIFTKFKK